MKISTLAGGFLPAKFLHGDTFYRENSVGETFSKEWSCINT